MLRPASTSSGIKARSSLTLLPPTGAVCGLQLRTLSTGTSYKPLGEMLFRGDISQRPTHSILTHLPQDGHALGSPSFRPFLGYSRNWASVAAPPPKGLRAGTGIWWGLSTLQELGELAQRMWPPTGSF